MRRRRIRVDRVPALGASVAIPLRHLRTVLRLEAGVTIDLFDAEGFSARATLGCGDEAIVTSEAVRVEEAAPVCVAVPLLKGERQDWLVEKLCELGVGTLIPLLCERAVFRALGDGKRARYERLIEAACKQSGRNRPLVIAEPTPLFGLPLASALLLDPHAPLALKDLVGEAHTLLLIGPEGGFSDDERHRLAARQVAAGRIADRILRAETAALAGAAVAVNVLCGQT